jgi:hypothetical protein
MPIETAELPMGTRYYWRCPKCLEISLPFREVDLAEAESIRHAACITRS